jgi:hypothetical protein
VSIEPGPALAVLGAAIAVWAVRAWFWPFAACRWCRGRGRNAGSNGRRWGTCWACGGSGKRQVLGSRALHRAVRAGKRRGK